MDHVLGCAGCLAELESAKALREELPKLAGQPTAGERAAILAAAGPLLDEIAPATAAQAAPPWWRSGLGGWAPRLAAAAALILVAALVALWPRHETRELRSASVLTYHEYIGGAPQGPGSVGAAKMERGF
jgi:hypothetical protein